MPIHRISKELIEEISAGYKSLTVLNLADNEIARIENLERLSRLTKLNLTNNKIQRIENLDILSRLFELHLAKNRISSIENVENLQSLEILDLSDNAISDLREVDKLIVLPSLKHLFLEGNPVSSLRNYRVEIIRRVPQIKYLDNKEVTGVERMYSKLKVADDATGAGYPSSDAAAVPAGSGPSPSFHHRELADASADLEARIGRLEGLLHSEAATHKTEGDRLRRFRVGGAPPNHPPERPHQFPDRPSAHVAERRAPPPEPSVSELQAQLEHERQTVRQLRAYYGPQTLAPPSSSTQVASTSYAPPRADPAASVTYGDQPMSRPIARPSASSPPPDPDRMALAQENQQLRSQLELTNIQLESLSKIVEILELSIAEAQHKDQKEQLEERVLTRWRQQVFSLLVNQRTDHLQRQQMLQRAKEMQNALSEQLRAANTEIQVLRESKAAQQAALQLQSSASQAAQAQAGRLQDREQELLSALQKEKRQHEDALRLLQRLAMELKQLNDFSGSASRRIRNLSGRLEFAVSRVNTLSSMLVTRDQHWRNRLSFLEKQLRSGTSPTRGAGPQPAACLLEPPLLVLPPHIGGVDDLSEPLLKAELLRVMADREQLLKANKSLAEHQSVHIDSVRQELLAAVEEERSRNADAHRTISVLQSTIVQNDKRAAELEEQIRTARAELAQRERDAAAHVAQLERDNVSAIRAMQEQLDKSAEEVQRANDDHEQLRRQHMKTVVTLRQVERQLARQKDRVADDERLRVQHLEEDLASKDAQIASLRKERNALLATVRQQERRDNAKREEEREATKRTGRPSRHDPASSDSSDRGGDGRRKISRNGSGSDSDDSLSDGRQRRRHGHDNGSNSDGKGAKHRHGRTDHRDKDKDRGKQRTLPAKWSELLGIDQRAESHVDPPQPIAALHTPSSSGYRDPPTATGGKRDADVPWRTAGSATRQAPRTSEAYSEQRPGLLYPATSSLQRENMHGQVAAPYVSTAPVPQTSSPLRPRPSSSRPIPQDDAREKLDGLAALTRSLLQQM